MVLHGDVRLSVSALFFFLCRDAKYGEVFRVYGVIVKYYTAKVWRLFEPCKFFSEKKQKKWLPWGWKP